MTKKILVLGVAVIMSLGLFAGCWNNDDDGTLPYNAKVLSFSDALFRDDFRNENRLVYGDESYSADRTFVVREQTEYEQIFADSHSGTLNFDNEMILLYTFNTSYSKITIKSLKINSESLQIDLAMTNEKTKTGYSNQAAPRQIWIVLQMDKLDVTIAKHKRV